MSMTAYAKASWPLLWTECDDQGVFEWKPVVLKARILPADNVNFDEILQEYLSLGVVMSFTVVGKQYGTIKNFRKYQRPKKPNKVHPNTPESETFACLPDDGSEPVGNQSGTDTEKSPQMEDVGCRREEVTDTSVSVCQPEAEKPKKQSRKTRLPSDWEPSPKNISDADAAGLTWQEINHEAHKFADHHRSRGNLMADWDAAWRTWIRKSMEFKAQRGGGGYQQESDLQRISRTVNEALSTGRTQ